MKFKDKIIDFIMITIGTAIVAFAVFFFMMPSKVSVGSIAALAMVLNNFVPIPVSMLTLSMNIILLTLGFIFIGKEFGIKTVYTATLMPIMMRGFELLYPTNPSLTNDQTLDVICYCVLVAVGQAMLFVRNASSGGLDIVAKFMNKFLHMELGRAVGFAGMAVAISSGFVYDTKTLVLSIISTYFNGLVVDHFIFGNTLKKRVCIISKYEKEILAFILHELHSGATTYHAYGAYSEVCRTEINAIVDKNEYQKLMNFIRKTDPDAFVTVYAVNEMMYKPKVIEEKK